MVLLDGETAADRITPIPVALPGAATSDRRHRTLVRRRAACSRTLAASTDRANPKCGHRKPEATSARDLPKPTSSSVAR
jgi:hypothetical protein